MLEYQVLVDVDPSDVESGLELARLLVALGKRGRAAEELLRVGGALAGLGEGARALAVAERAL
ncbi:MAG: hypothetical protein KC501_41380, partial [Myxococcales bacterium]|nr:hypothetical protein [Myxococcales bacterium]